MAPLTQGRGVNQGGKMAIIAGSVRHDGAIDFYEDVLVRFGAIATHGKAYSVVVSVNSAADDRRGDLNLR